MDKNSKGIWKYADFYSEFIKPENRLYLSDGNTRELEVERINKLVAVEHLYFKREDENETGSLKGRSLAYQVSLAKQKNKKELVISTSGNAGIAAAAYCKMAGIKLYIFISPKTERAKIAKMQKYNPVIIESNRAIRLANYLAAKYKIENLRPSINDSSIEGFKSIAFEIFERLGEIDAIFTFVTSGSSFVGIGRAYRNLLERGKIKKVPRLYAVQSGDILSVAKEFFPAAVSERNKNICCSNLDNAPHLREQGSKYPEGKKCISSSFQKEEKELPQAGKLGIKNTRRKKEIIELIKFSGGSGIYVNENETKAAKVILEENGIYTSSEGCASFAAVIKTGKKNKFNEIVCILSGKLRSRAGRIDESRIYKAESFSDVDDIRFKEQRKHKLFPAAV